jgi:hypothetical protein
MIIAGNGSVPRRKFADIYKAPKKAGGLGAAF